MNHFQVKCSAKGITLGGGGGGGGLPSSRIIFHGWIDCYGVAFLQELREWGRTYSGFRG